MKSNAPKCKSYSCIILRQNPEYNLTYNNLVDFDDFFIFADNFGRIRQSPSAQKTAINPEVAVIAQLPTEEKLNILLAKTNQNLNQ